MCHKILELYSGIGGMHCAWTDSGLQGEIVAAVDINTIANIVYKHNFPKTKLLNKNIQSIKIDDIKKMNIDTILMSPPCQPFTRNGNYLDDQDPRSNSFIYLIGILEKLENVKYILMENVKGFESSSVRNYFIETLSKCQFDYQEFLLSPLSMGIPNSRLRYYCIARRGDTPWNFKWKRDIMESLPEEYVEPSSLKDIICTEIDTEQFLIPDKLLEKANLLDICHPQSKRSCCFTKAYTHYVEGTGSVFTNLNPETIKKLYENANKFPVGSTEFVNLIKELKLRFFTPREVLSLMSFPNSYMFPENVTKKQCYRLLGNSLNVKVISELLKILFA